MTLDRTDAEEIVNDCEGRQGQIYGGQLFHDAHGIPMSKTQPTRLLRDLQAEDASIAEVEHEMRWNATALVDQSGIDSITRIAAQPADQLVGTIPAFRRRS